MDRYIDAYYGFTPYVALSFYDCSEDLLESKLPEVKTLQSACADVKVRLHTSTVRSYTRSNMKNEIPVVLNPMKDRLEFTIMPGERVLAPTGWKLIIPHGYQVKIVPRSGLALKYGITLINTPGTIDSDYTDELMIILHNTSDVPYTIYEGDSIAQLEMMKNSMDHVLMTQIKDPSLLEEHKRTSNRNGGFGHTGV